MLGTFDRSTSLEHLEHRTFDLLVIGGGITGAGVALDAASRGLRVALVERDDFASGTSSKSSKLIHGGIRYLQQGEFRLVYEALAERHRLLHNAPHLVQVVPFLLPVFTKDAIIPPKLARALGTAMWMYDLTGGARIGKLHERVKPAEVAQLMPNLRHERIAAAYKYYDAQADDARLTLTIARTAALGFGAVIANYAGVASLSKDAGGQVDGAVVRADGRDITVRAAHVVNATGVWSDEIHALDSPTDRPTIRPAKGVHITIPWELVQNEVAVIAPVRGDKRSVFVCRWGDFAYVGTTDTDYDGPLENPQLTNDDIDYLLGALNGVLRKKVGREQIVGTWAGLRPLVAGDQNSRTADLSRTHSVQRSKSGVITVTGGKLTTYRRMAKDAVDLVVEEMGRSLVCRTRGLRLQGAKGHAQVTSRVFDLDTVGHLVARFGTDARTVMAMAESDETLQEPLVPGLPYLKAEAAFATRCEMAVTVDDVLSRRTRARLFDRIASLDAIDFTSSVVPDAQAEQYRTLVAGDMP